jgi:hypothetical protein
MRGKVITWDGEQSNRRVKVKGVLAHIEVLGKKGHILFSVSAKQGD